MFCAPYSSELAKNCLIVGASSPFNILLRTAKANLFVDLEPIHKKVKRSKIIMRHELLWILLLQIVSISAVYYKNGYWNFNKKFDCSQRCVGINLLCDGTPHCSDDSDEENCINCSESEAFHCKNDRCIPIYLQCDGHDDCWDGSDEWKCSERKIQCNEHKYNVPMTVHRIDAPNEKIKNFSIDINRNENFTLPMLSFKTDRSDQALDGRTVVFEHFKKVVFYIPGFMTNDLSDGLDMKNALVHGTDDVDCVVLVDWRQGSYRGNSFKNLLKILFTASVPVRLWSYEIS